MSWGRWAGTIVTSPVTAAAWGLFALARDGVSLTAALIATGCWGYCVWVGVTSQ